MSERRPLDSSQAPGRYGDPGAGGRGASGGSRAFAEVRTPSSADRLDLWRGERTDVRPLVSDVLHGRPAGIAGHTVVA